MSTNAPAYPILGTLQTKLNIEGVFVWAVPRTVAKPIPAFLTTSDSEAKRQGYDFVIVCCSAKCQSEVEKALALGLDVHEMVAHKVIGFGGSALPGPSEH